MDEKKLQIIERVLKLKWEKPLDELLELLDDIDEFYTSRDQFLSNSTIEKINNSPLFDEDDLLSYERIPTPPLETITMRLRIVSVEHAKPERPYDDLASKDE